MDKLLQQTRELFDNHKKAIAIEEEYTSEIYDFLIKEGKINLTKEEKSVIFAKATREYTTHMNNILSSGCSPQERTDVLAKLQLIKTDQLDGELKQQLVNASYRIAICECFDKLNYLDLK